MIPCSKWPPKISVFQIEDFATLRSGDHYEIHDTYIRRKASDKNVK